MKVLIWYALAFLGWTMLQHQIPPLDPKTLAPAEEFATIDDLLIHFVRAGESAHDPVLLLHGFGGWSRDWLQTIPALAQAHEVFAPDLPGWGLSQKPGDYDYSLEAQAKFVLAFMDHFGLERVDVVGNSMGGGIAVYLAAMHPERVGKLVLIDSVGYRHFYLQRLVQWLVKTPGISYVVKAFLPEFARFRYHTRWLMGDADKDSLASYEAHYQPLRTPGTVAALVSMVNTLYLDSVRDLIPRVNQPTLILWGQRDPFMPVAHAARFNEAISGSTLVVFPDAGHVPQAEVPDQVNPVLVDFLK